VDLQKEKTKNRNQLGQVCSIVRPHAKNP
jgi:hypothetical protein